MKRLGMKNHNAARLTLSHLIREFYRGEITEDRFRALVYGFNCLLGFFKLDMDSEYGARLEAIEVALDEGKQR